MKQLLKNIKYFLLMKVLNKKTLSSPSSAAIQQTVSIYDFTLTSIEGKAISLSNYKGKKLLIVNTASECGYTPQYTELEELHQQYKEKLTVLGFPANNFGGQEPLQNTEIATFCQRNFGVTFQLFEKSDVIGKSQNPLYNWLTHKEQNGWNDASPNWNFCKYLIDENGKLIKFFSAGISPLSEEVINLL